jgi:hypothetical protein
LLRMTASPLATSTVLRHPREMTLLCSPKVTQHHMGMGAAFDAWPGRITPLCKHRRERVSASVTNRTFHHSLMCCDRSRSRRCRWRRAVAQMMWKQSARCGVDDIAGVLSCSGELPFFAWVTLSERKWVILAERRGPEQSLDVVTGYHGLIYVDNERHFVHRITLYADDIPPSFPLQEVNLTLDYDYRRIGDAEYLLPLRFELVSRSGSRLVKNDVDYDDYQKFNAVSVIVFDSPGTSKK